MKRMNNKFHIKKRIINILKGVNLYKEEQRVIMIVLLCFLLSGAGLPLAKEHFVSSGISQPPGSPFMPADENNGDIVADPKGPTDDKINTDQKDTEDNKDSDTPSDETKQTPSTNQDKRDRKDNRVSDSSKNQSQSNPSASSNKDDRKWVPPVYKTVHHEAVYETKKVVICNYCSAAFNSTGEFQVHKDAHGG